MKTLLGFLICLSIQFFGQVPAQAHGGRWSCLDESSVDLGVKSVVAGECLPGQPLAMAKTFQYYKWMKNNPWEVKIWKGSYIKTVTSTREYLHRVYDRCVQEVIVNERKSESSSWQKEFNLVNPNLDPEIATSYQLAPMTDAEAKAALGLAKSRCEAYRP